MEYSLKDRSGENNQLGIKWSLIKTISDHEDISGGGYSSSLYVDQYYLTSKEAVSLIADEIELFEDEIENRGSAQ